MLLGHAFGVAVGLGGDAVDGLPGLVGVGLGFEGEYAVPVGIVHALGAGDECFVVVGHNFFEIRNEELGIWGDGVEVAGHRGVELGGCQPRAVEDTETGADVVEVGVVGADDAVGEAVVGSLVAAAGDALEDVEGLLMDSGE